ncbi:hypothetical protein BDN72DRAFT_147356 [Pluteus cervinus]|uniref:Uncharacterized protein n=1 Tax=Pluteus cervinus TaxID=181527 RepID=A0ACD3AL13_9AGAR|nr:hypothetical protein BDN72DRAFT_147356 [Pluteus cervinus]
MSNLNATWALGHYGRLFHNYEYFFTHSAFIKVGQVRSSHIRPHSPWFSGRILDKFATLFSPETPRTSPTLDLIQLASTSKCTSICNSNPPISATDSEFGAFVAIPATEGPLAAPIIDFAESPVQPAFSKVRPKSWTSSEPFSNRNPSLTFFGKFAQDAKVASNHKGYCYSTSKILSHFSPHHLPSNLWCPSMRIHPGCQA